MTRDARRSIVLAAEALRPSAMPPLDNPRTVRWFLRSLVPRLAGYRLACAGLVAALLIDVAFDAMLPLSLKFIIDNALLERQLDILVWILAALGAGGVVVAVTQVGRDYLYANLGARVLTDLRQQMYAHLQRLSLGFFSRTPPGEIMARFSTDLAAVENAIVVGLPAGIMATFGVLVSATILAVLEWRLALLAVLGVPLCAIGPQLIGTRAARANHALKTGQSALSTMIEEHLGAQPVVKAFELASVLDPRFRSATEQLRQTSVRANFLTYLMERTPNIGVMVFNLLVIGVGSYLAFVGRLSIGSLVTFQALLLSLTQSVYGLTWVVPHFVAATAGLSRIEEILAERPLVEDRPGAAVLPRLRTAIAFDAVSFGYVDNQTSLDAVTVELAAGTMVAFVGASGSGKSTALNLLLRFYDPRTGAVRFDGHDLRDVTQESLHAQVGVVFQESLLFNTSIRENIRFGQVDASDADIERAARQAEVHDAILAMPDGYATIVGERGGRLSGGQRQRIAIARALLRNPAVLLLDEATSALDPVAEASINATIEQLRGSRTIISVTHRLAAASNADRILIFSGGRIVESGTHASLLAGHGAYRDLWEKQSGLRLSADGDRAAVDIARLRHVPILSGLDEEQLAELPHFFGTEHYDAGRDVIQQGDHGDRFYIVARGRLAVIKVAQDGSPDDIAMLSDGDHFGEVALLRQEPRNATVRALTPSVLLSLPHSHFLRLVERAPALRARLDASLAARM